MKQHRISEAEWEVMEVIWRRSPISAAEIHAQLSDTAGWAMNTVRTMLARLVKKAVLKFGQEGNAYLYRPAVPRERCVHGEVRSLLQRVFGGAPHSLLTHFVEHEPLTPAQIQELQQILKRKEADL